MTTRPQGSQFREPTQGRCFFFSNQVLFSGRQVLVGPGSLSPPRCLESFTALLWAASLPLSTCLLSLSCYFPSSSSEYLPLLRFLCLYFCFSEHLCPVLGFCLCTISLSLSSCVSISLGSFLLILCTYLILIRAHA